MEIGVQRMLRNIDKQDLCDYLGEENSRKIKKAEYEKKIIDKITSSDFHRKRFLKKFESKNALSPAALEEVLGCTKTERLRWQKEGKLKIVGYDSFKYGEFPLFSLYQVSEQITPETLDKWREEHKALVVKNRAGQAEKSAATRRKRDAEKEKIMGDLKEMKSQWYGVDCFLSATFELAYWTVWMSRLAKTYQLKAQVGRHSNVEKYLQQSSDCYEMKNKAVFALAKSPYSTISFYRPEEHYKETLYFCDEHMEMFREERPFYDYGEFNKWDFYYGHKKEINKCPRCIHEKENDYYSLYYLKVHNEKFPDTHFSFHTPYGIGLHVLGEPKDLPKVHHQEQDGMFRFGRPLVDEETYLFTLAFVTKQFRQAMETYQYILNKQV